MMKNTYKPNLIQMTISLKLHNLTITVRSVFEEDSNYYAHFFFFFFFFLMNVCMSYKDATQYKKISIENRPNYFFNDIINTKCFDPNLLEIHKLSCKSANISIYHIEHMQMK